MKITFVDLQVSYWYTENDNCEHLKFSHADNNDKKNTNICKINAFITSYKELLPKVYITQYQFW